MKNTIIKFAALGLVVWLAAMFLPGIAVKGYLYAVFAAVILGLINAFIKPIVQLVSLPITILTLGLFGLVINALMILLLDWFLPGFAVSSFWSALLLSVILSVAGGFIDNQEEEK